MSLTSLLNKREVFELFDREFGDHPALYQDISSDIYIPPLTENYALVGTAFDYLFRFYISKLNNIKQDRWIADYAISELYGNNLQKANAVLKKARLDIKSNNVEEWPLNALKLGRLDKVYRENLINFSPINKKDIKDLERLINIVQWSKFTGDAILNPGFNNAWLVGGADADLIIGDLLIDIKTTKYLNFTKQMFFQLIGYKSLADNGGVYGYPDRKIKRVGIYFSRHQYLYIVDDLPDRLDLTFIPD